MIRPRFAVGGGACVSVTYFCNPHWPLKDEVIWKAGKFLVEARSAHEAAGYEVQTTRLATVPFPKLFSSSKLNRSKVAKAAITNSSDELPRLAEKMEQAIRSIGVAYCSLGPALPEKPRSYEIIPEAIAASQNIFFGGIMADSKIGLSLGSVRACAEIIQKVSSITPDGFSNLRFAALANVKAGAPFFPAAYHDANKPAFAIATELQLVHVAQALDHVPARGAHQVPLQLEQSQPGAVQEQVDGFVLSHAFYRCLLDRVDPEEIVISAGAQKGLELRDDARRPGSGAFKLA